MNVIPDDFDWTAYDELPERSKVIRPSSLTQEVVDLFYGPDEARGKFLPWDKTIDRFRFRRREVTVYAGINGHFKSTITSQIALGLMRQGERALIASFEMRPAQTMQRMTRQAASTDEPAVPYIRRFHWWTDDRLWIYDHFGNCDPRKAIAVCHYAARELGVRHFVVDSLMKCVRNTDDYTGQKVFVGDLCALALATDAHVHLVAHAKKKGAETDTIDKFDVRGAGEITDQVDNVVLIQRNKQKELAREPDESAPDLWFTIAKQRNGAFEGTIGLYHDTRAGAFVDHHKGRAVPLLIPREPGEDDE